MELPEGAVSFVLKSETGVAANVRLCCPHIILAHFYQGIIIRNILANTFFTFILQ